MSRTKTAPGKQDIRLLFLDAMLDMMENKEVWECIKNRSAEEQGTFLFDRFKAAHQALREGMSFDEWHEEAKRRGVEPKLAQLVWDQKRRHLNGCHLKL